MIFICLAGDCRSFHCSSSELSTSKANTRAEHEVVPDVVDSLKVNTRAASMRIAEFVFYYAATQNRRKVSASHKATADPLAFQKGGFEAEDCRSGARPRVDQTLRSACLFSRTSPSALPR